MTGPGVDALGYHSTGGHTFGRAAPYAWSGLVGARDVASDVTAEAQRQVVGQHGGVRLFVDDDAGYLAWLAGHPDGLVLNTYRTPSSSYLRLHQAGCRTITGTPARGTRWTADYAKGNRFAWPRGWRLMPRTRLCGSLALSFLTRVATG